MDELFVGPRVDPHNEHSLGHSDVVVAVHVPARETGARSVFLKARERSAWDFSLASVALEPVVGNNGRVARGSMALGGVAPNAWDATQALEPLFGNVPDATIAATVAERSVSGARPLRQNSYKIELTRALVERAVREVLGLE